MGFSPTPLFDIILPVMAAAADLYLLVAIVRVAAFRSRRPAGAADHCPPVVTDHRLNASGDRSVPDFVSGRRGPRFSPSSPKGREGLIQLAGRERDLRAGLVLREQASDKGDGAPCDRLPPVSVLKPVCGLDHALYENLCTFCRQDYPVFQIVFGVRAADDPAVAVIQRVIRDFPRCDATLVVDGRISGRNLKVSNLANILPAAKHDLLVIADSDMRVDGDYLRTLAASFQDPRVGAVTCLYRGTPAGGLASMLGALYINDWFLPSVLVALSFQKLQFCLGATMAVRREALAAIGGFPALVDYLADDYELGNQLSRQGYLVALSPYVVEDIVAEPGLRELMAHELRWARTIRTCRPAGYAFSPLANNALSIAVLTLVFSHLGLIGVALAVLAIGLRLLLHFTVRIAIRPAGPALPWLLPLRDVLCLLVWAGSFLGRSVTWKEHRLSVATDGRLQTD